VAKKINDFLELVLNWVAKRNWQVISGIIILLVIFEIFELLHKNEPLSDPFHWIELFVYVLILVFVGVLINFLLKARAAQNHTMGILSFKHNFSMELTKLEEWDMLTGELVRFPGTIASVEASGLYVRNPVSKELETAALWDAEGTNAPAFLNDCQKCMQAQDGTDFMFSSCLHAGAMQEKGIQSQEYCLPLNYADHLLALVQFRLKPGEVLSDEQFEIFENIRYEMALALRASQQHKRISEMRMAETALAERHSISTYLHDNLSQNLAYLCIKFDQLLQEGDQLSDSNVQTELQHMKDAANHSYDIVRGVIEKIHPQTSPRLVNLFNEYGKKVSERAHFEISIEKRGKELPILPAIQQTLFYVFQEALSNIEKYAHAQLVNVLVDWDGDCLEMTISDDGVGFDRQNLDPGKHFGLDIMQERINKVDGQLDVRSYIGSGTQVYIHVPVASPQRQRQ